MFLGRFFKPKHLWSAAKRGDIQAISQLVAEGHDVNGKRSSLDLEGATPLHVAALAGQNEVIKKLIELGARVNAKDDTGATPLRDAVTANHVSSVELLVELGANIDACDKSQRTALDWAAFEGNLELVKLLLKRGAKVNRGTGTDRRSPMADAVVGGNMGLLKLLISAGADVNAPYDDNPLSGAAVQGRQDFVTVLLEAGANLNQQEPETGQTPLISAVAGRNMEIVKCLVAAGARVNAVKWQTDETALDFAEKINARAITEFLKSIGAKRASELPKALPKDSEPDLEASWELRNGSFFVAKLDSTQRRAVQIKAYIAEDDYNQNFVGAVEFRVVSHDEDGASWCELQRIRTDEDGNVLFEAPVTLPEQGRCYLQFRIHDDREKEIIELRDWNVDG